jgi:hypothetical protein
MSKKKKTRISLIYKRKQKNSQIVLGKKKGN